MNETVTVRPMRAHETPLVAAMNQRLQVDEQAQRRMTLEAIATRLEGWVRHEGYRAFVAARDSDQSLIGYLICIKQDDPCVEDGRLLYIRQLYVEPAARRRGIGTAMIDRLIAEHASPNTPLEMDVLTANPSGHAFWLALGFNDRYVRMRREPDRV